MKQKISTTRQNVIVFAGDATVNTIANTNTETMVDISSLKLIETPIVITCPKVYPNAIKVAAEAISKTQIRFTVYRDASGPIGINYILFGR